jgi:hypothetical protein
MDAFGTFGTAGTSLKPKAENSERLKKRKTLR